MRISFSWLKQYVKLPDSVTAREVAEKLKLATVEVESVIDQGAALANVVVGKVVKAEKHPNADKLKVCAVDVGTETITIVCGGSNVSDGMLTAVAKNGAKVKWHGEGDLVELKPTTIRGVESNGMICGADEIGLAEMFPKKDEKEIVDLAGRATEKMVGKPLADVLGLSDAVFEIDNKSLSNRPDLWGHYGVAREVAVLTGRTVEEYSTKAIAPGKEMKIKVEVQETKLCPRYMAVAMNGIVVGESPTWLKERLVAAGLRPINTIVDITNFVMLDLGQPMHAFDAEKIADVRGAKKIIVRKASDGEKFTTLDGAERVLTADAVMIATSEKAVALAGVMGGLESGITSGTTSIIFESANFDATSVRKTSTRLGIRTDSSARFEKSLDPNLCQRALERAVSLVTELCPGAKVASSVIDEKHFHLATGPIEIPFAFFTSKIGVELPPKTIVAILARLGFDVKEKKQSISVKIPSWRATKDIAIAEDVVEEVVRIFGYDNVPAALPSFAISPPEKNLLRDREHSVRDTLVRELGYTEVYNYSFVSERDITNLGESISDYLELDNPVASDRPFVRRHLITGLARNIEQNQNNYAELRLFEIGKLFKPEEPGMRTKPNADELLPSQETWFSAAFMNKKVDQPLWEARRVADALSRTLGVSFVFASPSVQYARRHPSRSADILIGDTLVGAIYELSPIVAKNYGIEGRVGVAILNLSKIPAESATTVYHAISAFPAVERDIAFVVDAARTHAEITAAIAKADPLVTNVALFDVFAGKNVEAGKKSMAYHITFARTDRTLTSDEASQAMAAVQESLKKSFGALVRS